MSLVDYYAQIQGLYRKLELYERIPSNQEKAVENSTPTSC